MINKEIEKLKKKLNFDKGCHVLGYITGDKDETISIEEIENILQYIDQLEKTVKRLEFQDKANKKVHDYDVNMIDKVKGESVEQYKKIRELEDKVKELECDNHNKENKIIEQEIFLQMSTEVIKNSLLKQVIREKIEEINKELEKYREYTEQGIETDVEWVDNVADRQIIKVLQELLEEK